MQLFVIEWSFLNAEDQLFATNEFCDLFNENKLTQDIEDFELISLAHTPQNGSGIIICKAKTSTIVFKIINMWRENFNILFNIKPALTSEELLSLKSSKDYYEKD